MLRALLVLLCVATFSIPAFSADPPYVKTADGVVVYTDPVFTGAAQAVKLEVVAPNIIRVLAAPGKELARRESLVTVYKKARTPWTLTPSGEKLTLKTKQLTAVVLLKTGAVSFFDAAGKKLLSEKGPGGRFFQPAVFEGERLYAITQTFQTTPGDAQYGLGQHQDDVLNYKGEQVTFFQNNTEVAIPFLVSPKGYGILWDNYSLTRAGDVRPYHELHALKLYSKEGSAGWLTATYSNDKTKPADVALTRAEATLNYEFLNDSKLFLPAEFKPSNGMVTWEGSIASDVEGVHKLRFTFGGYIKVWVDGKLLLDRWRKAWNPAPHLLNLAMQKGKQHSFRMEWIPEGSESYISLKWLEPAPAAQQNDFAFASEAGRLVDYYFVHGKSMDEVIGGYRTLTGKAPIVPRWALGFWQSRERYKTAEEILSTAAAFRKRRIPLDNIVLDWSYWKEDAWGSQEFDASRFPAPDSMVKALHEQHNAQIMISVWPKFYEGIAAYNAFNQKGWLYKRNIADRQRDWIGEGYVSTFYDAFNADARKGFWNLINAKIWSKGFDAWWMDASEPDILSNVSPQRRKEQMTPTALGSAAEYLNAYPLQNAKGIYEGQRSVDSNKRVFLLTRSGFAGSQRYAAAIWSGDIGATWHDMKAQIPAGINFSMSGLPYWTMDIGGFVVEGRFEKPDEKALDEWRELNTRWFQFGAFVPLFRVHGQFPYREIYNVAPEEHPAYQSMLYYNKLRYRLLPYIYSLAGAAYHNDYTLMRGLAMDFPADTAVFNIGDQYLFGPSLLINPVYGYKQRSRSVYLPKGTGWYDLYSGKHMPGGQRITADAPYERMPVYVREGAIIPFGPELQYTSEKRADTISLAVYTGRNAAFTLYEDGGTTYDYEKGAFANIRFDWDEAIRTMRISDRSGSFTGMLAKRVFRITAISPGGAKGLSFEAAADKEVVYEGKRLSIKL